MYIKTNCHKLQDICKFFFGLLCLLYYGIAALLEIFLRITKNKQMSTPYRYTLYFNILTQVLWLICSRSQN